MGFLELMLLAVGLSMDALAVSICKGLAMDRVTLGRMVLVGLWFGGFQEPALAINKLMPTIALHYIKRVSNPW